MLSFELAAQLKTQNSKLKTNPSLIAESILQIDR